MSPAVPVILLVEDEKEIRRFVRMALETEGCRVIEAEGCKRGLIEAGTRKPELLILDLGLPDGDGVEFIRDLRGWSSMPVIVLSARSQEADKIQALDAGADDYLTKPFGVGELLARVRAVLRRLSHAGDTGRTLVKFGEVSVDLVRRVVEKAGQPVHFTPIEYRLLALLINNAGKVLTHRQILREVWGPTYVESSHYLRVYMGHLRQKLEDDPTRPRYIITETGVGYRFVG
jgi:two-component system KDP operon response regulator KdpE